MQNVSAVSTGSVTGMEAGKSYGQKGNTGGQTRYSEYQNAPRSRQAKGGLEIQANKAGRYVCM